MFLCILPNKSIYTWSYFLFQEHSLSALVTGSANYSCPVQFSEQLDLESAFLLCGVISRITWCRKYFQ